MNTLYQGVTLRIPQFGELVDVSAVAATQEAMRQTALWQGNAAQQSTAQQARLRLVLPSNTAAAGISTGGSAAAATAEVVELESALGAVRGELEDSQRLLEIQDEQMQELQALLTAAEEDQQRLAEQLVETGSETQLVTATGVDLESEAVFADEVEPRAETSPVIEEPAVITPPAGANRVVTTPSEPSLVSRVLDWFTGIPGAVTGLLGTLTGLLGALTRPILLAGAGVVVLAGAAAGYLRYRQRDVAVSDVTGRWEALEAEVDDGDETFTATGSTA